MFRGLDWGVGGVGVIYLDTTSDRPSLVVTFTYLQTTPTPVSRACNYGVFWESQNDGTWFEVYQCPSWMIWKSVLREHEVQMTYFGWEIFDFLNIF